MCAREMRDEREKCYKSLIITIFVIILLNYNCAYKKCTKNIIKYNFFAYHYNKKIHYKILINFFIISTIKKIMTVKNERE